MRLTWVQPEDLLPHQLVQSRSEGVDVTDVQARWLTAGGTTDAPASGGTDIPASAKLRTLARELLDLRDGRTAAWREPVIPDLPPLGEPADLDRRTLDAWLGR